MRPVACKMPSLEDLRPVPIVKLYMFRLMFHGTRTINNRTERAYIVSFIRILDKTMYEYGQSRQSLQDYIKSRNKTIFLMKTVSHLETCVSSLRRCLCLFERMKALTFGCPCELRIRRNRLKRISVLVRQVRNAIEHMDELIARDEIAEGAPIALMISEMGDCAYIAGSRILFSEIASTIRELHVFAVDLCDYRSST
jgi:hypothetical protein